MLDFADGVGRAVKHVKGQVTLVGLTLDDLTLILHQVSSSSLKVRSYFGFSFAGLSGQLLDLTDKGMDLLLRMPGRYDVNLKAMSGVFDPVQIFQFWSWPWKQKTENDN